MLPAQSMLKQQTTACVPKTSPALLPVCMETQQAMASGLHFLELAAQTEACDTAQCVEKANAQLNQASAALLLISADGPAVLLQFMQSLLASQLTAQRAMPVPAELVAVCANSVQALHLYLDRLAQAEPLEASLLFPCYRQLFALQGRTDASLADLLSVSRSLNLRRCAAPVISELGRQQFEQALLNFLRSSAQAEQQAAASKMAVILADIAAQESAHDSALSWQVLQAFAELAAEHALPQQTAAKKIFAAIARQLRHGADAHHNSVPAQLIREALFALYHASTSTALSAQLVAAFELNAQLSEATECAQIRLLTAEEIAAIHVFLDQLSAIRSALELPAPETTIAGQWQELAVHASRVTLLAPFAPALQQLAALLAVNTLSQHEQVGLAAWQLLIEACLTQPAATDLLRLQPVLLAALEAIPSRNLHQLALRSAAASMHKPAICTALKTAITHGLLLVEAQLEDALQTGSLAAVYPAIDLSLAQVAAALSMCGDRQACHQLQEIRHSLARYCNELADSFSADGPGIASAFARLGQRVAMLDWAQQLPELQTADSQLSSKSQLVPMPVVETYSSVPVPAPAAEDGSETSFTLSPALQAIYQNEARQLIQQLAVMLNHWCVNFDQDLPLAALHAAHSLAGSSATVGLQSVQELAAALELLLQTLLATYCEDRSVAARHLLETVVALEHMLSELNVHRWPAQQADLVRGLHDLNLHLRQTAILRTPPAEQVPVPENSLPPALVFDSVAGSESEPAAEPTPIVDAELLALFKEEAADLLPQLDQHFRAWQAAPDEQSVAAPILRILHTLKGSARIAGALVLGQQLHQLEHAVSQLAHLASRDAAAIEPLLAAFDAAMQELASLTPTVVTSLKSALSSALPSPSSPSLPSKEATTVTAETALPGHPAAAVQLRVRADLLDQVASSSAELMLGTARLNAELQAQRQVVTELSDNILRLRAQLRELEMQAETRIASQLQTQTSREFDPLEFDQFTRLQELARMMTETVGDIVSVQRSLTAHMEASGLTLVSQSRHARTLQADLRQVRIVQFSSIAERLHHLVRQTGRELGRQLRLEISGGALELDRGMLEKLNAPLEHLLRNAVAHGIEAAAVREAAGKPAQGCLQLQLSQQANTIEVQVRDDGRGLDLARIREQAVAAGLLSAEASPSEEQLTALIFEPGLSTADEVTPLSGRGIGMDIVRDSVLAQGGTLQVASTAGIGTCFTLRLPLTLATTQVVLLQAARRQLALPSAMVQHVLQLSAARAQRARQAAQIDWRGEAVPLYRLAALLAQDLPAGVAESAEQPASILVLHGQQGAVAIEVDSILGNREVVIKNSGPQLAKVAGIAGATMLADGSIVLIINPLPLIGLATQRSCTAQTQQQAGMASLTEAPAPTVLVVDDSLTVRRVSERLLERNGYAAVLARDGLDALEKLQSILPAAILLDIEMPRMDGFELLRTLRSDSRWQQVPVVMITSRTASKHHDHAVQLGANAYLGKPYQETELLAWLKQTIHQTALQT